MSDSPAPRASTWRRQGAWDGVANPGYLSIPGAPGIIITPRYDLSIAYVISGERDEAATAEAFSRQFGIELPLKPRAVSRADLALVWSGPAQWLALSRQAGLSRRLVEGMKGLAAITDQSDARAVLTLEGARVRDVLAKGLPVDLHPRSFRRGDAAVTTIAGIGVQLWQAEDSDAFTIALARSMAGSFWSWLTHSAAEFGAEVRAPVET